jgi:hypothetical protein
MVAQATLASFFAASGASGKKSARSLRPPGESRYSMHGGNCAGPFSGSMINELFGSDSLAGKANTLRGMGEMDRTGTASGKFSQTIRKVCFAPGDEEVLSPGKHVTRPFVLKACPGFDPG